MYKLSLACVLFATVMLAQATSVISLPFSTGHGSEADLTLAVRDPNGIANISEIRLLIKHDINAENACYLVHYPGSAYASLRNDSNSNWSAPVILGGSGTAANNQCTLYGGRSEFTAAPDGYTLKLHIHFATKFAGLRRIWAQTVDNRDPEYARWNLLGEWVVPEHPSFPGRIDRVKVTNDIPDSIDMSTKPSPEAEPRIYRNGLLQSPTEDYTISDRKVFFASPIRTGDVYQIEYSPVCNPR
jgi:hypothetical protein